MKTICVQITIDSETDEPITASLVKDTLMRGWPFMRGDELAVREIPRRAFRAPFRKVFLALGLSLLGCSGDVPPAPQESADAGPCPAGYGEWYGGLCARSMAESECPPGQLWWRGLCAVARGQQ